MPVYTVHEPPRRDDDALGHAMRFRFVRDGFHFWAFLLTPLWMLRHRLWIELIAYLLLLGGVVFAAAPLRYRGERRASGSGCARGAGRDGSVDPAALEAGAAGFEKIGSWSATTSKRQSAVSSMGGTTTAARQRLRRPPPSPFGPPSATSAPASDMVGLFPQPEARP